MGDIVNRAGPVLQRSLRLAEAMEAFSALVGRWCAYASAAAIFLIVVLLVASSIRRYVMGDPIAFTEELGSLLFLSSAFLTLTYGFTEGRHVRLELLWRHFSYPWRELLEVGGQILALFALAVLVIVAFELADFSLDLNERSEMTEIPLWPWRFIMPFALCALTLAIASKSVATILRITNGQRPYEGSDRAPIARD